MSLLFSQVSGSVGTAWGPAFVTLFFFAFFVGLSFWAWRPKNRQRLEGYARMPLDDDEPQISGGL